MEIIIVEIIMVILRNANRLTFMLIIQLKHVRNVLYNVKPVIPQINVLNVIQCLDCTIN